MIDLNRQEGIAVLFLSAALLVGTGVAIIDHLDAERFEDFHVVVGAVEAPSVPVPVPVAAVATGPLAINRADAEQLQSLPYIGPRMAAAIIEYRQVHGPFSSVDDLNRVSGIGVATVERLRLLVSMD